MMNGPIISIDNLQWKTGYRIKDDKVTEVTEILLSRDELSGLLEACKKETQEVCAKIAEDTEIVLDDHPRYRWSIKGTTIAKAIRQSTEGI